MTKTIRGIAALCASGFALAATSSSADEFDEKDVEHWGAEYLAVVKTGRALWTDGKLGTNGVACAQCHPNAANTHPETYPKYQKQLGRVISIREMIDWCVQNPLEGASIPPNDPRMIALESYITFERRGVALAPGKH
ncbi:MAG: cytochrome C [Deltaproteobacteria bacterium]|nr:cytochrome C [Deltaproteobacteria bacterium]